MDFITHRPRLNSSRTQYESVTLEERSQLRERKRSEKFTGAEHRDPQGGSFWAETASLLNPTHYLFN